MLSVLGLVWKNQKMNNSKLLKSGIVGLVVTALCCFSRVIRSAGSVRSCRLAGLYPFTLIGIFYWLVYICCIEARQYNKNRVVPFS